MDNVIMTHFMGKNIMNSQIEIKLCFQKYILILNEHVENWLKRNFGDYIKINNSDKLDISDYIVYSDSEEINILIDCYNVYQFHYQTNKIDEDAIKALIVYYYNVQVFDNNIQLYATVLSNCYIT